MQCCALSSKPRLLRLAPWAAHGVHQIIKREFLGTCAIKKAIWSLKMRRLRKMKSSHRLGT